MKVIADYDYIYNVIDYDYSVSGNDDYDYDYSDHVIDYNRLRLPITITPTLIIIRGVNFAQKVQTIHLSSCSSWQIAEHEDVIITCSV